MCARIGLKIRVHQNYRYIKKYKHINVLCSHKNYSLKENYENVLINTVFRQISFP